jgi:hypothetical protein
MMNGLALRRGAIFLAVGASIATLAACTRPAPPAPPPRPVVVVPAPAPRPMPVPPNSASPTLTIPGLDVAGRRLTPNVDLSPEQALWQLRIGLNVAALNCRGPNEAVLVSNYTTFLNSNRRAISAAERWVIADQGRRNGTNGIAARDALSTRLYNYFAQPPVLPTFCAKATEIMTMASVEPTASILPFSTLKIVELDRPFVDFYAAYDQYRADFAAWRVLNPVVAPIPAPATGAPAPASTPRPATSSGG